MKYLLLLDYDGTLTPIRRRPELARLSPKRRTFLRQLADNPNIKIAIISGRRLSNLKKTVGIPGLIYVGNHGLEIEAGHRLIIQPGARRFARVLTKIKAALSPVKSIKGVLIEDKKYSLSIHFRQVPAGRLKQFHSLFNKSLVPWHDNIKITSGKKVLEIRPPIDWGKGQAAKWLIKKLGHKKFRPVYIGDDRTDEDAFKALKGVGITIKIGKSAGSLANSRLKNVAEVYRWLASLPVK